MVTWNKLGTVTCMALAFLLVTGTSYGESEADLIVALRNAPDSQAKMKAAHQLKQYNTSMVCDALCKSIREDSDYHVKTACLGVLLDMLDQSASELGRTQPQLVAQEKEEELREEYRARFRVFLAKSYVFNCDNPSSVKARVVPFFRTSDKDEDFELLLAALRDICAMSFEDRKKLEQQRPGQGDDLLSSLVSTISIPRGRTFKTVDKLVYCDNVEYKFIPILEKDLKQADGDYKLSLLIILGEISTHERFDLASKARVKTYTLEPPLLKETESLLVKTKSRYLKREALRVLNGYKYELTSDDAKQIQTDFIEAAKSGIKY